MTRRAALFVVLGITLLAAACGGEGTTGQAGADLTNGKELFVSGCASCHALADAGAQGQVGPNLDHAFGFSREQGFDESSFFDVTLAQIDIPAEGGAMPPDIYIGQDAVDVAAYVAEVAGIVPSGGQPTGGGAAETGAAETGAAEAGAAETEPPPAGGEDGKAVFASAGCGSCHTLADAGTTGTIGPNLDDSKPSADLVVERVTNGRGVMPSFRDQLSEAQIQAVAEYVSSVAGR